MVPVTNLVFRLSYKGPRYARHFVTQERIGGPVHERRDIYVDRSPLYHVDKLQTPLLVHVADNDRDVNFEEAQQLVHALEYLKPDLAETRIYRDPPRDRFGGGHRFNRRVDQGPRLPPRRQPRAARLVEPDLDLLRLAPPAVPDPRPPGVCAVERRTRPHASRRSLRAASSRVSRPRQNANRRYRAPAALRP